jgi:MFS-type transporter involved in bile tolerance (Atg22 family)
MVCVAMNMPLLPIGAVFIGSILMPLLSLIIYKWRKTRRYSMQVFATIKHIQIWLDGWYVTAVWTDVATNRIYMFHSQCIEFGLKQRVGDSLLVQFDPKNPDRYAMHF